jgi:RNA recognition motif-containing protein
MSIRLYVGNLPAEIDRQALETVFNDSGDSISLKVITDRKTGKCRGFGFVTVGTEEIADSVIDKFNGYDFNGVVLKLEKALPRTKTDEKGDEVGHEDGVDLGEKAEVEDGEPAVKVSSDVATPTPKSNPAKRSNNSKSKRSNGNSRSQNSTATSTSTEPHQPDPRWAQELEQLKQRLLEAQTAK